MTISDKKEPLILLLGDILFFYLSLWVSLFIRYGELPGKNVLEQHFLPFSILSIAWIIVFFIAGLYEKHTLFLKSRLPKTVLSAQVINSIVAFLFFYFIPYFGITPKTNLFIYLFISFLFILGWRNIFLRFAKVAKRQKGILIGSGKELIELREEIEENNRYNIELVSAIDLESADFKDFHKEIINRIYSAGVSIVIIDIKHEKLKSILPHLYNLIFSKVYFIDMHNVYEEIFDRIPLSLVRYSWFIEHLSLQPKSAYDVVKRAIDIIFSFAIGILSLILYPFTALAIKIDDGGSIFYVNKRLGKNNKIISIIKFRTMSGKDTGKESTRSHNKITRVGKFLRQTRIDELPQLWNVFRGDLSLIGPRPEIPELAHIYEEEVPYYNVRHLIKPGLSGWAQIYQLNPPKFETQADSTKIKLSYDLYYIKNRSILLDLVITLKTLKALISRVGV